jgi:hypothetical protein
VNVASQESATTGSGPPEVLSGWDRSRAVLIDADDT